MRIHVNIDFILAQRLCFLALPVKANLKTANGKSTERSMQPRRATREKQHYFKYSAQQVIVI